MRDRSEPGRGQPPCPVCGNEYDEFVYEADSEGEPDGRTCAAGLGWYVHTADQTQQEPGGGLDLTETEAERLREHSSAPSAGDGGEQ